MTLSFNLTKATPFASAIPIQFRAYAVNGVGFGVYSSITTITTDSVPLFMFPATLTSITYNTIILAWPGTTTWNYTGGDYISYYQVNLYVLPCFSDDVTPCDGQTGVWTEITSMAT